MDDRINFPSELTLPSDPRALIDTEQLARFVGVSVRTVEGWNQAGTGPTRLSIGRKCIRYRVGDVLDWIDTRTR